MSLVRRILIGSSRPASQSCRPRSQRHGFVTRRGLVKVSPSVLGVALHSRIAAHLGSARQCNQDTGISLIFPTFRADGTVLCLASVPPDGAASSLEGPHVIREMISPLTLKSLSTAGLPSKWAGGPGRRARQVKSLWDRDACVSHPRRLRQL